MAIADHGGGPGFRGPEPNELQQQQEEEDEDPLTVEMSPLAIYKNKTHTILVAHAVMACAAWVLLFPLGAVLLRLNINHPAITRLHATIQLCTYALFILSSVAGVWVAVETQPFIRIWEEPHVVIGLIILGLATFQPFIGYIHHRIYRLRARTLSATRRGPRPKRTVWAHFHIWLGRALITLAIINGGIGLMLMENNPVQDKLITRKAEIGYGVVAGFLWCCYMVITIFWEYSASKRKQRPLHYPNSPTGANKESPMSSSENSSELTPSRV